MLIRLLALPTPYAPDLDGGLLAHDAVAYAVAWLPLLGGFFAILMALYIAHVVVDILKEAEFSNGIRRSAMHQVQQNNMDRGVAAMSALPMAPAWGHEPEEEQADDSGDEEE
jgi:hypothetical protein